MDLQQQLQLAMDTRQDRGRVVSRLMQEIKGSMLFQYTWENLLTTAPVIINHLSACSLAANGEAGRVKLDSSRGNYKHLKSPEEGFSLGFDLAECADLGQRAFSEAQKAMAKVDATSKHINRSVDDIFSASYGDADAGDLVHKFRVLSMLVSDCFESAKEMDVKFEQWLGHTSELYAAYATAQGPSTDTFTVDDINRTAMNASTDYQKVSDAAGAKDIISSLEKQLQIITESYKKASDLLPEGSGLLAEIILAQLADSASVGLNTCMLCLVDIMNKSGPSIARPKDVYDPAYPQAAMHLPYFEVIASIFKQNGGGINWQMTTTDGGKLDVILESLVKMLEFSQSAFSSVATDAEPSKTFTKALSTAREVIAWISEQTRKASAAQSTLPTNDSTDMKRLQAEFEDAYGKVLSLYSTARSLLGNAASGAAVISRDYLDRDDSQISTRPLQVQSYLESTKNGLSIASAAQTATQEVYRKATEVLNAQQTRLMQLNSSLGGLKSPQMSLVDTKHVLLRTIALIVNIKIPFANFVRFLKSIQTITQFVLDHQVRPFADSQDGNDRVKVGLYTISDLQRTMISNSALSIRSWFSVLADVASEWTRFFPRWITEGMAMLQMRDPSAALTMSARLQQWSDMVFRELPRITEDNRNQVLDSMNSRVRRTSETVRLLPSPPAGIQTAIADGVQETRMAAISGIETSAASSLLARLCFVLCILPTFSTAA